MSPLPFSEKKLLSVLYVNHLAACELKMLKAEMVMYDTSDPERFILGQDLFMALSMQYAQKMKKDAVNTHDVFGLPAHGFTPEEIKNLEGRFYQMGFNPEHTIVLESATALIACVVAPQTDRRLV